MQADRAVVCALYVCIGVLIAGLAILLSSPFNPNKGSIAWPMDDHQHFVQQDKSTKISARAVLNLLRFKSSDTHAGTWLILAPIDISSLPSDCSNYTSATVFLARVATTIRVIYNSSIVKT